METTEVATVFAPWLDLLPDDVDPDYKAAVRAEARALARHDQIGALVAELEAKVAAGAADPAVDPATLMTPASELAAARTLASVAPPIVPVPQARHNSVAAMLQKPNPANFRLPHPPAFMAELVHYTRLHAPAGELPPVAGPLDLEAIKAYEVVSAQAAHLWSSLDLMDDGPRGPMGDFVRAWHDTITNPAWEQLRTAIVDLTVLVALADAERPPAGSCGHGQHSQMRLQPAQLSEAHWSYAQAVRDGVLVLAH
jgi:hypothetical protein